MFCLVIRAFPTLHVSLTCYLASILLYSFVSYLCYAYLYSLKLSTYRPTVLSIRQIHSYDLNHSHLFSCSNSYNHVFISLSPPGGVNVVLYIVAHWIQKPGSLDQLQYEDSSQRSELSACDDLLSEHNLSSLLHTTVHRHHDGRLFCVIPSLKRRSSDTRLVLLSMIQHP